MTPFQKWQGMRYQTCDKHNDPTQDVPESECPVCMKDFLDGIQTTNEALDAQTEKVRRELRTAEKAIQFARHTLRESAVILNKTPNKAESQTEPNSPRSRSSSSIEEERAELLATAIAKRLRKLVLEWRAGSGTGALADRVMGLAQELDGKIG